MKYFTIFTLGIAFVCFSTLCLFAACDNDADGILPETGKLTIETSVEGYLLGDGATRATTSGLTTTFESGDAIGFFAIKSGSVIPKYNNLKLTYQGNGKWKSDVLIYNYGSDVTYLAYFPYRSDMAGKTSLVAIQSAFPIPADQTQKANFEAGNLLTAQTTLSSGTELKFNFAPAFSLVEIDLPAEVKGYSNAKGENYTYEILGGADFEGLPKAYNYDAPNRIYRMIAKPGVDFSIKINTSGWGVVYNKKITPVAGSYKKLALHDRINRNLQVGDFVYHGRNGVAFLPGSTASTPPVPDDCLGVVFSVGKNAMENNEEHGMVISKRNAGTSVLNWETSNSLARNYTPAPPADCSGWYQPGRWVMLYIFQGVWTTSGKGSYNTSFARTLMGYINRINGHDLGLDTGSQPQLYWTADEYGSEKAYLVSTRGVISTETKRSYMTGRMRARAVFKF